MLIVLFNPMSGEFDFSTDGGQDSWHLECAPVAVLLRPMVLDGPAIIITTPRQVLVCAVVMLADLSA